MWGGAGHLQDATGRLDTRSPLPFLLDLAGPTVKAASRVSRGGMAAEATGGDLQQSADSAGRLVLGIAGGIEMEYLQSTGSTARQFMT